MLLQNKKFYKTLNELLRNWSFVTILNFLSPISLQLKGVNLWFFKLRLFNLTEIIVWNIKGLQHQVAKINGLKIRVCDKDSIPFRSINDSRRLLVNFWLRINDGEFF